jgi:hypothetical protein
MPTVIGANNEMMAIAKREMMPDALNSVDTPAICHPLLWDGTTSRIHGPFPFGKHFRIPAPTKASLQTFLSILIFENIERSEL